MLGFEDSAQPTVLQFSCDLQRCWQKGRGVGDGFSAEPLDAAEGFEPGALLFGETAGVDFDLLASVVEGALAGEMGE
jgi:hypothetical protein